MAEPIDFYFDFSSPYAYLMSEQLDALAEAHGRKVHWRPFLLGAVYKQIGSQALPSIPLKGPYSVRDFQRSARFFGLPLQLPEAFPVATQHAARAYYWLHERDAAMARAFAHAAFRRYFAEGRDIAPAEVVLDLAATVGAERAALADALGSDALKACLRAACDEALARGVFGSPYVIVDGEPFWGVDRLAQIERWLETGGF